jgi:hypothetical protein
LTQSNIIFNGYFLLLFTFYGFYQRAVQSSFLLIGPHLALRFRPTIVLGLFFVLILSFTAAATPAGPRFSQPHGFRSAPFSLTLTAPKSGGVIRYTLDGSEPGPESGIVYKSPLRVSRTSVIRAAWISDSGEVSWIETRTYLFLEDIVRQSPDENPPSGWPSTWGTNVVDYGMDPRITGQAPDRQQIRAGLTAIPSLSVVLPLPSLFDSTTGIYSNAFRRGTEPERATSIELIDPRGGEGFSARGGLKIRGGLSRTASNPKHSFRVYFREEYGQPSLNYPLFGPSGSPVCDKFDLRCDQVASWHFARNPSSDFIRDQWARDSMLAMGQPADRGDFYHLYINGMYWGIYNTQEKHDAAYGAHYFGGDEEDYDLVKFDNGFGTSAADGSLGAWRRLISGAIDGFESLAAYQKIQGNNPDGRRNPAYERLLDVDNLIDYMLLGIYFCAQDSPPAFGCPNNWAGIRSRKQDFGFRFFPHDWELGMNDKGDQILVSTPQPEAVRTVRSQDTNPWHLWEALRVNTDFRLRVADHVQSHFFNGGSLTPEKAAARYRDRMEDVTLAVVAESARWGDVAFKKDINGGVNLGESPIRPGLLTREDWLRTTQRYITDYFPQRTQIVLQQLRQADLFPSLEAPILNPRVANLLPGQKVTLSNAAPAAQIFFTLDGSDPRLPGGGLSPSAQLYSGPVTPATPARISARTRLNSNWSPLVVGRYSTPRDIQGLRITEIQYHSKATGSVPQDAAEFLELKNTSSKTIPLTGLRFTSGISFEFPSNSSLSPGAFFVLGRDPASFSRVYPGLSLDGVYSGRLSNDGEEIILSDRDGTPLLSVTYNDSGNWPATPDGLGFTLVYTGRGDPDKGRNWRPSALPGGSPRADDPARPTFPLVVIQSVNPRPVSGPDTVTLRNLGPQPANISGWLLSNDPALTSTTRIPPSSVLNPGADLTVSLPISDRGGEVFLASASPEGALTGYGHRFPYGPCAPADEWQRRVDSTGKERFSGPNPPGIKINEIHYHGTDAVEFVELLNTGMDPVDISNWSVGELSFTFASGTTLPPGVPLVVSTISPEAFRASYGLPADSLVFGPASGRLSDSGADVTLLQPLSFGAETLFRILETVPYEPTAPWPYSAGGYGGSLQRVAGTTWSADPASWQGATPSPGRTNTVNAPPLITLVSPAKNTEFTPGEQLTLRADASDLDGTIREVRFFADAQPIGSAQNPPYSIQWTAGSEKITDISAEAEDDSGNITTTQVRTVFRTSLKQTGIGLRASYFNNQNLEGTPVERVESGIDGAWSDIDPVPGLISRNQFSVRWEGFFRPDPSGSTVSLTTLQIAVSGKLRLWVDDELLIDQWLFPTNNIYEARFSRNGSSPVPVRLKIEFANGDPPYLPFIKLGYEKDLVPASLPAGSFYLPTQNVFGFDFVTPVRLPSARQAQPYSLELKTSRGSGLVRFTATSLPAGLSLSPAGVLSGIPSTPGLQQIQVQASDTAGNTVSRTLQLPILPSTLPPFPSFTLTSPPKISTNLIPSVLLSGTVQGGLGIPIIEYKLNEKPWRPVQLTGTTAPRSFSAEMDLPRGLLTGANLVQLRATDESGRRSELPGFRFEWTPSASLLVNTEGQGSVSREFRGATLRPINRTYSLTATPTPNSLFAGWRNGQNEIISFQRTLAFEFTFAQTLTAVFGPSPFLSSAGLYIGSVTSSDLLPQGRGELRLQVNSMGNFTGRLFLGSLSLPLRGSLSFTGDYTTIIVTPDFPLEIQIAFNPGNRSAMATLSARSEALSILSNALLEPTAQGNPPSSRRNWRVSVSPTTLPNLPIPSGSAVLTFSSGYKAKLVGRLGDGSPWSAGSYLLQSSRVPLFSPLYKNGGFFSGELNLPSVANSSSNPFLWLRPPLSTSTFQNGFVLLPEVTATLEGSPP